MKELMSMIRQIGIPTFFLTLSAAETHWAELLVILAKILENRVISEEEAINLTFMEKSDLIQKDPVTTSRYFDKRIRELFKLIKANDGPFGKYQIIDTYIRIEFQQRGSPHVHCLLWLKDAPIYDQKCQLQNERCIAFIDQFITVAVGNETILGYEKFQ